MEMLAYVVFTLIGVPIGALANQRTPIVSHAETGTILHQRRAQPPNLAVQWLSANPTPIAVARASMMRRQWPLLGSQLSTAACGDV